MLKLLRVHARSWIIKLLLGAIVVVFVFWGVGSFRSQSAAKVAVVNGKAISLSDYEETYNNILEQLRQQFGNALNEDLIKMFQIEKQALDSLINRELLLQEAQKLNFKVTDDELENRIRNISAFRRAGVFDAQLYRQILTRYRLTPETFEKSQREALLVEKVRFFITDSAKVSDKEVREWYDWEKAQVDIDFVCFEPDRYTGMESSEEELRAYYDENKTYYQTEPAVKVQYLKFDPNVLRDQITISEEELREYYDAHPDQFKIPKTVEARHILLSVDSNAAPEEIEKKKKSALDIMTMAREGKDFATLAEEFSDCPSKRDGGYLGSFEQKDMVAPFADQAFAMNPGEISEPVKTDFGWHIIKIEKVNPAAWLSFEEAVPDITKTLTENKAKTLALDDAEAVLDASYEFEDLAEVAKERRLSIHTTDFFSKSDIADESIENNEAFSSVAFGLIPKEISEVKDLGDGFYIIQLLDKRPAMISDYEAVAAVVEADLIRQKQQEKAEKDAKTFLDSLHSGEDMQKKSVQYGVGVSSTGFFGRSDAIPDIGLEREISRAAFQLNAEDRLAKDVITGKKGYYVIRLRERKAPNVEGFEKEKDALQESLLRQKQTRLFAAWLDQLKNDSEIILEAGFFKE